VESAPGRPPSRFAQDDGLLLVCGAYVMLLLLGAAEGLVGSFQYSRTAGPVPVTALALDLVILLTCVAGAWGMRRPLGGLMPAVGWFVAALVLSMGTAGGSVVITDSAPGKWFLFGGAGCALAGVVVAFVRYPRRPGR
jgi:hypothetical protein